LTKGLVTAGKGTNG